jgi:CrcB protein
MLARFASPFPAGTFTVNLVGSFLIGVIIGLFNRYEWLSHEWRLFLAIGFCGSFTTFSTFSLENLELLREGNYLSFSIYTILSLVGGILLVLGGYAITKG